MALERRIPLNTLRAFEAVGKTRLRHCVQAIAAYGSAR